MDLQCTSIENKIKNYDSDSNSNSNETDHQPITLSNTYDEVSIQINVILNDRFCFFFFYLCSRSVGCKLTFCLRND